MIDANGTATLQERLLAFWADGVDIWLDGGWAMIAIAIVALTMFLVGVHVSFRLRAKGDHKVREKVWRRWLDDAGERRGPVGELISYVLEAKTLDHVEARFDQTRAREVPGIERDLRVMKICVSAAPLVGLLGTVMGMLNTFSALANGSGGDKTLGMVAAGISEALITTMTGLVIALPGLFFHFSLTRRFERYKAFLAHLQTVIAQRYHASAEMQVPPMLDEAPETEVHEPTVLPAGVVPAMSGVRDI